jgi:hypothetical protein
VDIYDVTTNTWTTSQLSEGREDLTAVGVPNKIVFAGGYNGTGLSTTADVYDVKSGTWTNLTINQGRILMAGASSDNFILFAGGKDVTGASKVVNFFSLSN